MASSPNFFTPLQSDGGALTTQLLAAIKAILTNPTFTAATVLGAVTAASANLSGNLQVPTQNNITAHSGGGQANAVALVVGINQINAVAANNDSVKLPASAAGISVVVTNATANNANLYPAANEAINQSANNAAFNLPANKTASFYCPVVGTWTSVLSA